MALKNWLAAASKQKKWLTQSWPLPAQGIHDSLWCHPPERKQMNNDLSGRFRWCLDTNQETPCTSLLHVQCKASFVQRLKSKPYLYKTIRQRLILIKWYHLCHPEKETNLFQMSPFINKSNNPATFTPIVTPTVARECRGELACGFRLSCLSCAAAACLGEEFIVTIHLVCTFSNSRKAERKYLKMRLQEVPSLPHPAYLYIDSNLCKRSTTLVHETTASAKEATEPGTIKPHTLEWRMSGQICLRNKSKAAVPRIARWYHWPAVTHNPQWVW